MWAAYFGSSYYLFYRLSIYEQERLFRGGTAERGCDMRKYKIRGWRYGVLDCRAAARDLNDMAAKGWRLKSFGKFWMLLDIACFERDENAPGLQYAVDARPTNHPQTLERYYTFYRDQGWRFVSVSRDRLHIFVSEKATAAPLYTDRQTEWTAMKENARLDGVVGKNLALGLFCILIAALFCFWEAGPERPLNAMLWGFSALSVMMAFYYGAVAWSSRRYLKTCQRCEERELPLPEKKSPTQIVVLLNLAFFPLVYLWAAGTVIYEYYTHLEYDYYYLGYIPVAESVLWWMYGAGFVLSMALFYGGLCGTLVRPGSRVMAVVQAVGIVIVCLAPILGIQMFY